MMDMDVLEAWVSGLIELNKVEWMLGAGEAWKPGEKLKLLFAGYNGTRNTGSDVRVEGDRPAGAAASWAPRMLSSA